MSNISDKPWLVPGHMYQYDIGWLVDKLLSFETELNTAIDLKTIHYADPIQWDITTQYAPNTVVVDPKTGTAYMSKVPVPAGVLLTNKDYWVVIFNYQRIYDKIMSGVAFNDKDNLNASKDLLVNDLVWFGGDLYRCTRDITRGTTYLPGTNLTPTTIADCLATYYGRDRVAQVLNDTVNASGDYTINAGGIAETASHVTIHSTQDMLLDADGNKTVEVGGKLTERVTGNREIDVGGKLTERVTGSRDIDVDGDDSVHVDGVTTINRGGAMTEVYGSSVDKRVTGAVTEVYDSSVDKRVTGAVTESFYDNATETYKGKHILKYGSRTVRADIPTAFLATEFGAKGDGVTDDSDAIQLAIDSAMAAGGGKVILTSGTYVVNKSIIIRPHTAAIKHDDIPQSIHFLKMDRVEIVGFGEVILKTTTTLDHIITFNDFSYPDNIGSYSNFYTRISNIKFDGTNVTSSLLYVYQALHSVVDRCQMFNCKVGLGIYGYGELDIHDNVIKAESHCIEMISGGDSLIYKNDLYVGDNGNGITMTAYAGSTSIFKNTFTPTYAGISGHTNNSNGINLYNSKWNEDNATTGPVFIHDNSFDGVLWGVKAYSSIKDKVTAIHIHDNKVTNNSNYKNVGLCSAELVTNILIHDNVLGVAESYEGIPGKLVELSNCSECIISSNLITSSTDSPIKIYNSNNIKISGNLIRDFGQSEDTSAAAISLRGNTSNCTITDNVIIQDSSGNQQGVLELDNAGYNKALFNTFKNINKPLVSKSPNTVFIEDNLYGYAAPNTGYHLKGARCYNQEPSNGNLLWVCTESGEPGTWKAVSLQL